MVFKEQHFSRNFIGPLLVEYQVISPNLTIFEIQVVNVEKKFCLESTMSSYAGAFQCFCSVPVQINSLTA